MREDDLTSRAVEQLSDAGFLVERGVRKSRGRMQTQADVLAHAGTTSGDLMLDVIVEVKSRVTAEHIESALAQLSRTASVFGARRAFIFDGEWFAVDASFTSATPSGCPRPAFPARGARVSDELVATQLWQIRDRLRGAGHHARDHEFLDEAISEAHSTTSPLSIAVGSALGAARLGQLLAAEDEMGPPVAVADAMARLLAPRPSWTVLDPAARLGGCLWATRALAISGGFDVILQGSDPNVAFRGGAEKLASLVGTNVAFESRGLLDTLIHEASVDGIVSAPPMNVRLPESVTLSTGERTTDADLALLDAATRWLRPGGRAVLAVVPRLLSAEGAAARLRAHIVRTSRVTAVVELPARVLPGAAIRLGLVVIEKVPPSDTLLADLGDDWQQQLSPTGGFMRAYHEHISRGTA